MNLPRPAPGHTFAIALGLVALITPLAVHLFLPVIPAAKVALGLSDAMAQLNFSIALLAMAFATLVYGSLSDRYGRRPMLLSGLLLFLAGSAIAALAETAATLLLGRVVQAVGAACGMTLVRTIARDAYRTEHLVRAISYLTMFYTLGPMVSPLFGGLLIDTLGLGEEQLLKRINPKAAENRRVQLINVGQLPNNPDCPVVGVKDIK